MDTTKNQISHFVILALSSFAVLALFIYEGNIGFSLWDEGYLWYGAQRVLLGEVPIRDFMAYDPGRYYWSAALMKLSGDNGIMNLRGAISIFQAAGLFIGLLLIARSTKKQNFFFLLLSVITLLVWMAPRHKLFDISLSIFLLGFLAFLVQNPTSRRYFLAGLGVGFVAVFGRNHGVYGLLGSVGVMIWLRINHADGPGLVKGFSAFGSGVIIGYLPVLLMLLLVPGYAIAFWESVRFLFELQSTNYPLPVPWPWNVRFSALPPGMAIHKVLVGLFFIATITFGILSIAWVVWQRLKNNRVSPVLVAASFLALPYAHYAFSRADISHLAQGIFPLLIGCFVVLAAQPEKIKWPLALVLCSSSLWAAFVVHPGWQCGTSKQCVEIEVSGSSLLVGSRPAREVNLLRKLSDRYASNGQSFIATPFLPGAYALLERKSPMWEIYALFPRSRVFEQAEIERIKTAAPGFALILDLALDGRNDLRFRNTHPMIHKYIKENFKRLPASRKSIYQVYTAKPKS